MIEILLLLGMLLVVFGGSAVIAPVLFFVLGMGLICSLLVKAMKWVLND